MPSRPPSIRSCGCVVAYGERCQHMQASDRARKARHDQNRPSARERGYDSKWAIARKAFLAVHRVCTRCGKPATVVDHKIPHRGDKAIFWDRTNWQPLCAPCHNSHKQRVERREQ